MSFLHLVILGLVQGLTEFLPVSSSAHLVIVHALTGDTDEALDKALDIAAHIGTLIAALLYFRRDILRMIGAVPALLRGGWKQPGTPAALVFLIIVASIPGVIAGVAINAYHPWWEDSLTVIAVNSIIFGIVLWVMDKFRPALLNIENLNIRHALIIGVAQALSLVPGVSRSGITMTAARGVTLNRVDAVRFSFFMSMVIIAGAGVLGLHDLTRMHSGQVWYEASVIALVSFISGFASIAFLLNWLKTRTFTPFVVYRVALGILLLVLLHTGTLHQGS